MSSPATPIATFRCPVCRAAQPVQDECRRCRADLTLLAKAIRHCKFLMVRRDEAQRRGDECREKQLSRELKQLVGNSESILREPS